MCRGWEAAWRLPSCRLVGDTGFLVRTVLGEKPDPGPREDEASGEPERREAGSLTGDLGGFLPEAVVNTICFNSFLKARINILPVASPF